MTALTISILYPCIAGRVAVEDAVAGEWWSGKSKVCRVMLPVVVSVAELTLRRSGLNKCIGGLGLKGSHFCIKVR